MSDNHDDFGGLARDFGPALNRRQALAAFGKLSLGMLAAACGASAGSATQPAEVVASASSAAATTTNPSEVRETTAGSTTTAVRTPDTEPPNADTVTTTSIPEPVVAHQPGPEIPSETGGPFPADGTNGPNVLTIEDILRRDITSSIGGLSGVAIGVPAEIEMTVIDARTAAPLVGAAVYMWHCTADGRYSLYEIADQNYLRGVQQADSAGRCGFTTIFPGCYRGRWPHCHLEIFTSLDAAAGGDQPLKTTQLALPQAPCEVVYGESAYGRSLSNLSSLSLQRDGVFRDSWESQLATVIGDIDNGYTASLTMRI